MGSKVSALTENTDPLLTDEVYLVDDPDGTPVSKRLGLDTLLADGWLNPGETWVYVSATSFKIVGVDRTARYRTGRKLRCKQGGGYKYFYVVSSAFVTDTTVTITGGSDYSLANAAITDNYLSYVDTPEGFPDWFAYTPTGVSATNVTLSGRFRVSGRTCECFIGMKFTGAITFTTNPTLPIASSANVPNPFPAAANLAVAGWAQYRDEGTATSLTSAVAVSASSTTAILYDSGGTSMSASSPITWANGDYYTGHFFYEI